MYLIEPLKKKKKGHTGLQENSLMTIKLTCEIQWVFCEDSFILS